MKKKRKSWENHEIKGTQTIYLRSSRNVGYVSRPCSKWGGLLSLNGNKEVNYNQLYINDPYTSNLCHGRKMENSVGETGCMVGFLARNHVKMTITCPVLTLALLDPKGIFSSSQRFFVQGFAPLGLLGFCWLDMLRSSLPVGWENEWFKYTRVCNNYKVAAHGLFASGYIRRGHAWVPTPQPPPNSRLLAFCWNFDGCLLCQSYLWGHLLVGWPT